MEIPYNKVPSPSRTKKELKLAMICRHDNSGLGSMSWEFARHLKPSKVLLVENGVFHTFPERYKEFDVRRVPAHMTISEELQEWLLKDMDVVLSIETFYNWEVVTRAKKKGVKTALVTMCEMMNENQPIKPDLYICPSELDFKMVEGNKVFIPVPVNTDVLTWRERERASVFIHTASHGGMNLRKGTPILLEAIKQVKADVKFIIYAWLGFTSQDPRVEIRQVNVKNYWQLWQEGDVLVYPQDYNGICLPVIEAMASGMGVITTDIYPFNTYFPKELLVAPVSMYKTRVSRSYKEMDAARLSPKLLADKIDEIAHRDIRSFSHYGKEWAQKNSWHVLLPQFNEALTNLCKT